MIVLLLWLWIMNLALLFGAEVDAELERGRQLQAGIKAEADIQLPPREVTASLKKAGKEMALVAEGRHLREKFAADSPDDAALKSAEAKTLWWLAGAGAAVLAVVSWHNRGNREHKEMD